MMIMDPKKAVATILQRRRSNMGEDKGSSPMKNEQSMEADGEMDPRHVAAQDILAAIHSQSAHHLKEALGNFHDLHKMHSESISDPEMA